MTCKNAHYLLTNRCASAIDKSIPLEEERTNILSKITPPVSMYNRNRTATQLIKHEMCFWSAFSYGETNQYIYISIAIIVNSETRDQTCEKSSRERTNRDWKERMSRPSFRIRRQSLEQASLTLPQLCSPIKFLESIPFRRQLPT